MIKRVITFSGRHKFLVLAVTAVAAAGGVYGVRHIPLDAIPDLWHFPSALVPIITIPIPALFAFIPMYFMGVGANIMSISGIAISIGVLVDGGHRRGGERLQEDRARVRGGAAGGLPRGAPQGPPGSRPVGLLLADGDRRGLPADLRPRGTGGPALQAARLDEEPDDAHGGGLGGHPRDPRPSR